MRRRAVEDLGTVGWGRGWVRGRLSQVGGSEGFGQRLSS
jgi:hypothetical protein